jgi:uncharacterized protein Veg
MNIDIIKEQLIDHIGEDAIIKCNLGRNRMEEYTATIKKTYNHIFLVEVKDRQTKYIKSFSYSDIITKTIHIDYKKLHFKK